MAASKQRFWPRLRAALARAREWVPVTNLGLGVAGLGGLTLWGFALPRADYALSAAAAMALALVGMALAAVLFGALLVRSRVRRPSDGRGPLVFEASRGFARGLSLPAWRGLPVLEVSWTWEAPVGFSAELERVGGAVTERVTSPGRALGHEIRRRFVVEDGFGLARVVLRHTEPRGLRVTPFAGQLDQAPLLRSLSAGDDLPHPAGDPAGDRVDMRRYVPGDPLRLALWKVYARTRVLMVRTPERALAPSVRVLAYLVSATGDEPAAAAARWAIGKGAFGPDWRFGADGGGEATDPEAAETLVLASRAARGTELGDAAGLDGFARRNQAGAEARLVVFVPARPGPWLARVADAARAARGGVTCVVAFDGLRPGARPDRLARAVTWLRRPAPADPEQEAVVTQADLHQVAASLRHAGASVVTVDRRAGRLTQAPRGPAEVAA